MTWDPKQYLKFGGERLNYQQATIFLGLAF